MKQRKIDGFIGQGAYRLEGQMFLRDEALLEIAKKFGLKANWKPLEQQLKERMEAFESSPYQELVRRAHARSLEGTTLQDCKVSLKLQLKDPHREPIPKEKYKPLERIIKHLLPRYLCVQEHLTLTISHPTLPPLPTLNPRTPRQQALLQQMLEESQAANTRWNVLNNLTKVHFEQGALVCITNESNVNWAKNDFKKQLINILSAGLWLAQHLAESFQGEPWKAFLQEQLAYLIHEAKDTSKIQPLSKMQQAQATLADALLACFQQLIKNYPGSSEVDSATYSLLTASRLPAPVRQPVCTWLFQHWMEHNQKPLVQDCLTNEHPEVRLEAAILLGHQGADVLRQLSKDDTLDDDLRQRARSALAPLLPDPET